MDEFDTCIKQGKLVKVQPDQEWVSKEMSESEYDLSKAKESLDRKDYKWSTVQSYYSMFHAAKALVLKAGYREKGHGCLLIALDHLYIRPGKIEREHLEHMDDALDLRHQADYGLDYSREEAEILLENATDFFEAVKKVL